MTKKKVEKKEPIRVVKKIDKDHEELLARVKRLEWRVDNIIELHDKCKKLKGI